MGRGTSGSPIGVRRDDSDAADEKGEGGGWWIWFQVWN